MSEEIDLDNDEIYILFEGLLFRGVCTPKSWSEDKVQQETNENFGRPGTSNNEWVISKGDALESSGYNKNPVKCPDLDDRLHWILNC